MHQVYYLPSVPTLGLPTPFAVLIIIIIIIISFCLPTMRGALFVQNEKISHKFVEYD